MRLIIKQDFEKLSQWVAHYVLNEIIKHQEAYRDKPYVLGLPTGGSIVGVYRQLINFYREKRISFKNIITFNMDEYVGVNPTHPQSYKYFMQEHLFDHVDIPEENINLPNGMASDLTQASELYEEKIAKVGGIDLFMGGIGRDGHLAFNEPGSSMVSRTRIKTLTEDTIEANARFFDNNVDKVPKTAMTVGIQTVMDARCVILIANGYKKSFALQKIVEEGINHMYTASALQMHKKAIVVCDEDAAENLMVKTYKYFKGIEK